MIATGADGVLATPGAGEPPAGWDLPGARAWWWALGAAAAVMALAYAPNLVELGRIWSNDDNYQHGFLVIPIALFILWQRFTEIPWEPEARLGTAPWWGWALLATALVVRAVAYERSLQWVETATVLPAIIGLAWAFGGRPLLYRAWPAIFFLVFMLPLPNSVNGLIALPLQRIAATGSYYLLQLSGFWVVQQGNVLVLATPFGHEVARRGAGLQRPEDADDAGRHRHGDDPAAPAAVVEADRPAGQRGAHRPDQQHHADRGDRVVLLLHQGREPASIGPTTSPAG